MLVRLCLFIVILADTQYINRLLQYRLYLRNKTVIIIKN